MPKIPESKIQLQNITLTKKINKDSVIGEKQNKINIIDADNDVVVVERGSVSQEEKAKEVLKALEIAKQESSESLQPWFNSDLTEEQKKQVEACFKEIIESYHREDIISHVRNKIEATLTNNIRNVLLISWNTNYPFSFITDTKKYIDFYFINVNNSNLIYFLA